MLLLADVNEYSFISAAWLSQFIVYVDENYIVVIELMNTKIQKSGFKFNDMKYATSGLILGLHPANERSRYRVTSSLIGWAQT